MSQIMSIIELHPMYAYLGIVLVALLISPILKSMVAWSVLRFAIHTETVVDDLFIDTLRPFRFVYALPVALGFLLANWAAPYQYEARVVSGLLLIILVVDVAFKLLSGGNAYIRHRAGESADGAALHVHGARPGWFSDVAVQVHSPFSFRIK